MFSKCLQWQAILSFQDSHPNLKLESSPRYKYPSPSVLELTGSLQRFNALSELDRHALQVQKEKLSRFKDMDRKLIGPSFS